MSRNTKRQRSETKIAKEIIMNSRRITPYDTINFWAMPLEKPNLGKPVQ
jgi:hypothetical protein